MARWPQAIWAAAGCLTGVWTSEMAGILAAAPLIASALLVARIDRPFPRAGIHMRPLRPGIEAFALFIAVGAAMWWTATALAGAETLSSSKAVQAGEYAAFEGVVISEPRSKETAAGSSGTGRSLRFILEVAQVEGGDGRKAKVAGRAHVTVARASTAQAVKKGERWRFVGRLRDPATVEEPGFRSWLRHSRVSALARVASTEDGVRLKQATGYATRAVAGVRQHARDSANRYLSNRETALLLGVSLGDGSLLDERTIGEFRSTGLSHLVVASGMNVAIVAGVVLLLLSRSSLPRWQRASFAALAICAYVLLAGAGPPVARAGLMACVALTMWTIGRKSTAAGLLAASALALSVIDPFIAFDISFQLSFCATLGLLLLVEPLQSLLMRVRTPFLADSGESPSWLPKASGTLVQAIAVTLAAQLAVLPVILHHFGTLSPYSLLANLAAAPVASVSLVLGLIGPLTAPLGWLPGLLVYAPLHLCLSWMLAISSFVAGLPGAGAGIEPLGIEWSVALAGAVMIIRGAASRPEALIRFCKAAIHRAWHRAWRLGRLERTGRTGPPTDAYGPTALVCMALACFIIFPAPGSTRAPAGPPGLLVHFLDVGQGDAALVRAPSGDDILIDTGPPGTGVESELRRLGVRRLRALVISHFDADHSGSLPALLDELPVQELITSAAAQSGNGWKKAAQAAATAQVHVRPVAESELLQLGNGAQVSLVAPLPPGAAENINDASLIARVTYGDTSFLFTGDLEATAQQTLLSHAPSVPGSSPYDSDVLKVPHHGSRDSVDMGFLQAVSPSVAVISVGCHNGYHHPTPEALSALAQVGTDIYRTDRDRSVVLFSDGGQVFEYAKGPPRKCR